MQKLNISVSGCCDDCETLATVAVRGETDSFGYETIYLCGDCHKKMEDNSQEYSQGIDVEDTPAPDSIMFIVSEC